MKLYICEIDTYYRVIAVSTDREKAINLAGKKALAYLKDAGVPDFKTVKDVIDYFSPTVTEIEQNTAVFVGN